MDIVQMTTLLAGATAIVINDKKRRDKDCEETCKKAQEVIDRIDNKKAKDEEEMDR